MTATVRAAHPSRLATLAPQDDGVAAEAQRRVFDGRGGARPIDAPRQSGANQFELFSDFAHFRAGASSLGNGMHALLNAAFASGEDRGRALAAGRDSVRSGLGCRDIRACAVPDSKAHANPDTIAIA